MVLTWQWRKRLDWASKEWPGDKSTLSLSLEETHGTPATDPVMQTLQDVFSYFCHVNMIYKSQMLMTCNYKTHICGLSQWPFKLQSVITNWSGSKTHSRGTWVNCNVPPFKILSLVSLHFLCDGIPYSTFYWSIPFFHLSAMVYSVTTSLYRKWRKVDTKW